MNRAVGIIPARLQSTRFPAKPLALLCGRPMIQHTYEAACKATSLSHVYVATDSEVIAAAVDAPSSTLLTSEACENGTARVLDALRQLDHDAALSYDIVVNIQGDEPLVDPMHIDMCVAALQNDPTCVMSTLMAPIHEESEARSPHIVKCVTDHHSNALYFSRGMIPSSKDDAFEPRRCMKHIGLYAFRRSFLVDVFPQLKSLHTSEDLEQLRVLEAGYKIKMVTVPFAYPGVDLPSDVAKVERLMTR
ncbi:3-deoxy-D-manno-octulosonate cytidylyltransferase [Aphanomyces invadans]|uniref:3-deoxy-D-manno-octulosonate cytidylyltransferase n=1 Tax=Aphanomyces invadans TaxID=157072 RepID=A0A024TS13_9STRA|nr:3-deoxy-D-manno-octulosonate cytidylyltransferase [Aphanomyces invadans]ETV96152.1 3-deoxy-D-manno-octulosonate cytidylyltransferase [Aphanomyces invadans]|eukprot:XP_008875463.1 3-deoxy-D-manno-octulosonate cytidylyltransferase [Aphanomyces invadans]